MAGGGLLMAGDDIRWRPETLSASFHGRQRGEITELGDRV